MKSIRNYSLLIILLLIVFTFTQPGITETSIESQNLSQKKVEQIHKIIEFAIEHNPVLEAQQEVKISALNISVDEDNMESVSEYIKNTLKKQELERKVQVQEALEKYENIKKELVSNLLNKISNIFSLKNKIKNQNKLHQLLEERLVDTERQVEAGLVEPEQLKILSENIIEIETTIADAVDNVEMLKYEIAFNYGDNNWKELLEMLNQLDN